MAQRLKYQSSEYQEMVARIYQRDKGKCQSPHCRHEEEWHLQQGEYHIDHIVPVSKGGTNSDENLRVLCVVCHVCRDDSVFEPTNFNSHHLLSLKYLLTDRLSAEVYAKLKWTD